MEAVSTVEAERQALERGEFRRAVWEATSIKDPPLKKKMARGGMHNEGIPLGSKVIPILVAAPCYWMRKYREFLRLRRNWLTTTLCISPKDLVISYGQRKTYQLYSLSNSLGSRVIMLQNDVLYQALWSIAVNYFSLDFRGFPMSSCISLSSQENNMHCDVASSKKKKSAYH